MGTKKGKPISELPYHILKRVCTDILTTATVSISMTKIQQFVTKANSKTFYLKNLLFIHIF